jgi:hypothetical protein
MIPHNFRDLTGQTFGRFTVLGRNPRNDKNRHAMWDCVCSCGNKVTSTTFDLQFGRTKSCGCWKRDRLVLKNWRHGYWARGVRTELFRWYAMLRRCYDRSHLSYSCYGGRGIQVCDEWRNSFEAYLTYIRSIGFTGAPGQSIDRINNDGHYEPGNLRVTDAKGQARNKRNNHMLTAFGETHCLADWASMVGISSSTLSQRLRRGWLPDKAISTPLDKRRWPKTLRAAR